MTRQQTQAGVVAVIERHVDGVLRRGLRSTTDPGRSLPRFKKRAEQVLDERALDVLLAVLADVVEDVVTRDRLRADSYDRIDGQRLEADDKRLRRRLQGIPESGGLPPPPEARE